VNYDYGYFYDYENILCADDWELEETFQKILKENIRLAKIYDELLNLHITESWKKNRTEEIVYRLFWRFSIWEYG
jgi:hypothetical protein